MSAARNRRRGSRQIRGSSLVELFLFALLFVPLLMYSTYITDVLVDWLKTQEAVGAAGWQMSGELLHNYDTFEHTTTRVLPAAVSVVSRVGGMYQGLDEWARTTGPRTTPATRGGLAELVCAQTTAVVDPWTALLDDKVAKYLHTGGITQCQSGSLVSNVWLGGPPVQHFADGPSWWSQVPLYGTVMPMTLCGVGLAQNGQCRANNQAFTLVTDEWALCEEGDGTGSTPDGSSSNTHFTNVATIIYGGAPPAGGMGGMSGMFLGGDASAVWGVIPVDPLMPGPLAVDVKEKADPYFGQFMMCQQPASGGNGPNCQTVVETKVNQTFNSMPWDNAAFGQGLVGGTSPASATASAAAMRSESYLGGFGFQCSGCLAYP